ncbi:MAG: GTPase [Snowella sp.]|nr:MAG: GTPase [Snowella sp.]
MPSAVNVKLLDLPGLSYVEDEGNLSIIKQCREALCLVTYNSAETDSYKVDKLLAEVVDQVKDLGGSPARMLFILNRIDIFRSDYDWQENEHEFVEDTTENIKEVLIENLQEYTHEIESLAIVKLSSWPALLSLQIRANKKLLKDILEELPTLESNWSDHDRDRIKKILKPYEQAMDHFQSLIKEVMKRQKMSVDPKEWSCEQQELISSELRKQSYAEDFEKRLSQHIDDNFPKLIIPQVIERFNVSAGNSIAQWSVQTSTAILNSSEKDYEEEKKRLLDIKDSLDNFLQESNKRLTRSLKVFEILNKDTNALSTGANISDELTDVLRRAIADLQNTEPYNKIKDKLAPLSAWKESLSKTIIKILESVVRSLDNGVVSLEDIDFNQVNPIKAKQLKKNLERLIELGYSGTKSRCGFSILAKSQKERDYIESIQDGLFNLSVNLTSILEPILKRACVQEKNRIEEAVSELFKFHLKYVEGKAGEIAKDVVIRLPESQLNKFTRTLDFSFELDSDIKVSSGTYRSWKWLWMKKLDSLNAEIPSTEILLSNWITQFQQQGEPDMVCLMLEWLIEQIDDLKKNIAQKTDDAFDTYMASFQKAVQEITADHEEIKAIWQPIQRQAKYLEKGLFELGFFEDVEEKI